MTMAADGPEQQVCIGDRHQSELRQVLHPIPAWNAAVTRSSEVAVTLAVLVNVQVVGGSGVGASIWRRCCRRVS